MTTLQLSSKSQAVRVQKSSQKNLNEQLNDKDQPMVPNFTTEKSVAHLLLLLTSFSWNGSLMHTSQLAPSQTQLKYILNLLSKASMTSGMPLHTP